MEGILLVDKPADWTSHDVVAKVRSKLRAETGQKIKVGHAGTLDPFATGLLILLIGSYTKKAAEFSKLDKTYEAKIVLGKTSSTGDPEGKIKDINSKKPAEKDIEDVLSSFVGEIEQTPHAFSAIKVDGQRAYKLARQGKSPAIEPRKVTIYEIGGIRYEYPQIWFTTRVSSGTYIRSLAEDIGQKLATGAYLQSLSRTEIGKSNLKGALALDNLDTAAINKALKNRQLC